MAKTYYSKKITIARCDKKGNILGPVERWEAHEKAILHRAFSVVLKYKNLYLVQHRKHPVFDGVLDVTCSSHQIYDKETKTLQDTIKATITTLLREWKMQESDIVGKPKIAGNVYYKAKDKYSIYTEHEVDDVVEIIVKKIPEPNLEFSYGASLMTREEIINTKRTQLILAPWVKAMFRKNLI